MSPATHEGDRGRDLRLLSAAFRGDSQAVGSIFDDHAACLYRLARSALSSSTEAQDVVVDVMVQACTPPGLLDGGDGDLRLVLARETYEQCLGRRAPGTGVPVGAVAAVCLFAGCSSRQVAHILGVDTADVPHLLTSDLRALAGPRLR